METKKVENYIIVRVEDKIKVIFEEDFIDDNFFKTQNEIGEVLRLIYGNGGDFEVHLCTRKIEEKK